jgi:hypothetical protein
MPSHEAPVIESASFSVSGAQFSLDLTWAVPGPDSILPGIEPDVAVVIEKNDVVIHRLPPTATSASIDQLLPGTVIGITVRFEWSTFPNEMQSAVHLQVPGVAPQPPTTGGHLDTPPPAITNVSIGSGFMIVHWSSRSYGVFHLLQGVESTFRAELSSEYDIGGSSGGGDFTLSPTGSQETYWFKVQGCIVEGIGKDRCSEWSQPVSVTVPLGLATPPAPVALLSASALSPSSISIQWTNNQPYHAVTLARYRDEQRETVWTADGSRGHVAIVDNAALPRTAYRYVVTVALVGGESRSQSVDVTTPEAQIASPAHSGWFVQSNFGAWGNYEMMASLGSELVHFWRNNDDPNYGWNRGATFEFGPQSAGKQVKPAESPVGVALLQSNIKYDGFHGNFEVVARMRKDLDLDGSEDYLAFFGYDTGRKRWTQPQPILLNRQRIAGVTGTPAMIQGSYGGVGNYEMLVPQGSKLVHYWRNNDDQNFGWNRGATFDFASHSAGNQGTSGESPLGVTLLQSNIKYDGVHGNFEVVVRMHKDRDADDRGDYLSFFGFDTGKRQWTSPQLVLVNGQPITGVTGDPAMIQSNYGGAGNYEMLVPEGSKLVHYWRNNDDQNYGWNRGATFDFASHSAGNQGTLGESPLSVALLQSNIKYDDFHGNFEVVVRLHKDLDADDTRDYLASFGYDSGKRRWTRPQPILVNGQPITDVTG